MKKQRGTYVDRENYANIEVEVAVIFNDDDQVISAIDDDRNDWIDGLHRSMGAASIHLH